MSVSVSISEVIKMDILESKFMEGFKRLTADAFKKGWHERNGGNLTYRVKPEEVEAVKESLHEVKEWQPIGNTAPGLAGEYFLVTGSGKYMRNVSLAPEENVMRFFFFVFSLFTVFIIFNFKVQI